MERTTRILLADDDPADRLAFRWALEDLHQPFDLFVVSDGDEALSYLFHDNEDLHPRPDVVVIDLNMPRVSGFAVLNALRNDKERAAIPVIVMSNSCRPSDKVQTRGLGAREYCLKPRNPDEYAEVVKLVLETANRTRSCVKG